MALINFQLCFNSGFIENFYHKVLRFGEQFKLEVNWA